MSIKTLINKALIASDALLRAALRRKRKTALGKVLVIFQQALGDAVLISDSLREYPKIFAGYDVVFVARPSIIKFLKDVMPGADGLNFEAIDFKRFIEDYGYYREISGKYRGSAEILIVPASTPSAEIFSCANDSPRKIASVRPTDIKSSLLMFLLSKLSYTEKIRPDKNEMTLQRHRQLIHYLGNRDFLARLPRLKHEPKIIAEDHYCVICAGASKPERWWPAERFAEIADFLNDTYNMNVHLCGGQNEAEIAEKVQSLVKHPERVINHVGATSFAEWSSIVQHSDLVVANDSATAHLAAVHRVKTVCIIGAYEFVIFPYKVDVLEDGDRLPLCVYHHMPCEYCRDKGYFSGCLNSECLKRLNEGKCALCIDAVTADDVKNAIIKIMKEG
ncbi:MAG: glycosyltransferase family 9 protein [Synergistaceae bacterium]|nr:glycosyltransferase family 9 protein [Synergistaceae bacterium]